ncbi:MAG TPA: sensor histidine kinase [Puia sp.]|nr:sensor histidine kinase [Puia sp.]
MNRKLIQVTIHVTAWACFLMLPIIFYPRPKDASLLPEQTLSYFFILSNFFYISFYYLNANLLIPKLLVKKKMVSYAVIILLLLIFFGVFPRLYQYFIGDIQRFYTSVRPNRPRNFRPPLLSPGSIAIFLLVFVFSTGIKVINQWFLSEQRNKEIQNEKLQTELSYLKAQINPHFLFNTLNNIYSLAADRSEKTAEAVMKLANIMRYVLSEARNDLVPLEKEIQFTTHYIELQKMRITDKTKVEFTILGDPAGLQISPLLFLPFIENAFKYGVSTREMSPIIILLEIKKDRIFLEVVNNKHASSNMKSADNTGIGINNTRRRLDLIYPGRYSLETTQTPTLYTATLSINLT